MGGLFLSLSLSVFSSFSHCDAHTRVRIFAYMHAFASVICHAP
jgi:hypothetical protein